MIQRVGDATSEIIAAAGEDLELECIATGANPPPTLAWFANGQAIATGHSQENKRQGASLVDHRDEKPQSINQVYGRSQIQYEQLAVFSCATEYMAA